MTTLTKPTHFLENQLLATAGVEKTEVEDRDFQALRLHGLATHNVLGKSSGRSHTSGKEEISLGR